MPTLYVARSAALSKWASDVGQSKHVFKVGVAEGDKTTIPLGWAGLDDWKIIRTGSTEAEEADVILRVSGKAKMLEPRLYPKLKGTEGVFKVTLTQVENYLTLSRALAGVAIEGTGALKPTDFADYLFQIAG